MHDARRIAHRTEGREMEPETINLIAASLTWIRSRMRLLSRDRQHAICAEIAGAETALAINQYNDAARHIASALNIATEA
jgi:hypothetical protein